jgi:hypothetical protein
MDGPQMQGQGRSHCDTVLFDFPFRQVDAIVGDDAIWDTESYNNCPWQTLGQFFHQAF